MRGLRAHAFCQFRRIIFNEARLELTPGVCRKPLLRLRPGWCPRPAAADHGDHNHDNEFSDTPAPAGAPGGPADFRSDLQEFCFVDVLADDFGWCPPLAPGAPPWCPSCWHDSGDLSTNILADDCNYELFFSNVLALIDGAHGGHILLRAHRPRHV